jgi:hypothetical protein
MAMINLIQEGQSTQLDFPKKTPSQRHIVSQKNKTKNSNISKKKASGHI